jgi:hypothetical protein
VQRLLAATDEPQPTRGDPSDGCSFTWWNKFFMDVRESLTAMLEGNMPGASARLVGIDATPTRAIDPPSESVRLLLGHLTGDSLKLNPAPPRCGGSPPTSPVTTNSRSHSRGSVSSWTS